MEKLGTVEQKLADFIYEKPEVVVKLLQKYGYNISVDTATLSKINELTFKAIIVDSNIDFANDMDMAVSNDIELNAVGAILGVFTSLITSQMQSDTAKKNRQAQYNITLATLSSDEKLANEKLRSDTENARTGILANSMLQYRTSLQTESTARLKDTWLYVTGLGIGLGVLFGVYLISKR
jgi:hypothetical protein